MDHSMVFFTIPIEPSGPTDLDRYSWTPQDGFVEDPSGPWVKTFRRWTSGPDKGKTLTFFVLLDSAARWENYS